MNLLNYILFKVNHENFNKRLSLFKKKYNFKGNKFIGVWEYLIDFEKVYLQKSILK